MGLQGDALKQERMREFYDTSSYYTEKKTNFADVANRFKRYSIKNIFSIYYPSKNEKIIDLGCGWGNISLSLQRKGFDVLSIDYSKQSIEICRKTARKLGLDESRFLCRDATNTKLKSASFDVAYCADLIEHLYPKVYINLLKEVRRILKKGGRLILYAPNPAHYLEILKRNNIILKADVAHVDYKTIGRVKKSLIEQGFIVRKAYFIESHIPVLSFVERLCLKFVPAFRRRIAVLAIKK